MTMTGDYQYSSNNDIQKKQKKVRKRLAPTLLSSTPLSTSNQNNDKRPRTNNNNNETNEGVAASESRVSSNSTVSLSLNSTSTSTSSGTCNVDVPLIKTPRCDILPVNSHADIQRLFTNHAEIAEKTFESWARDPDASWIRQLKREVLADSSPFDAQGDGNDNKQQERLGRLAKQIEVNGANGTFEKFEKRASFATAIIELWLEDKTLDQVLSKAKELGQLGHQPGGSCGGVILSGDLIRERIGLRRPDLGSPKELIPIVERLVSRSHKDEAATVITDNNNENIGNDNGKKDPKVSMYRVRDDNNFLLHPDETVPLSKLKQDAARAEQDDTSSFDKCGSLNTVYEYGIVPTTNNADNDGIFSKNRGDTGDIMRDDDEDEDDDQSHSGNDDDNSEESTDDNNTRVNTATTAAPSAGVPLLDEFYEEMEELTAGLESIELNRRLYLIWKGPGYMTAHHQDSHVPPQITIYNQMSGVSIFHFLPVLVGLYVTHVGQRDVSEAARVLKALDDRGIGSVATLTAGSVAMIFPYGSHGVFVPPRGKSSIATTTATTTPSLQQPQQQQQQQHTMSTIRAAEFFVQPLLRRYHSHFTTVGNDSWCRDLMPLSQRDVEIAKNFETAQQELLTTLGIDQQEWIFYARRMLNRWEKKEEGDLEQTNGSDDDVV